MKSLALSFSFMLVVLSNFLVAQKNERSQLIFVQQGPILLDKNLETEWDLIRQDSNNIYDLKVYAIIQFKDIPNENQKAKINDTGIELVSYIPNYAWLARINPNLSVADLKDLNITGISNIHVEWKLHPEMLELADNNSSGYSAVRILFWKNHDLTKCIEQSNKFIDHPMTKGSYWIEGSIENKSLIQLANQPFVQYIEWSSPTPENEGIMDESEGIFSTYISDNPAKGYYFNGSNVKIAVDEGGNVDSLDNPDYMSRLDRSYEIGSGVSGHKTGVAIRMAGAGNINPKDKGNAFGALIYSGGIDLTTGPSNNINIINRSYGWGCTPPGTTYNSSSSNYDYASRIYQTFTVTHSAGNIGSSNCYAGHPGWGNITGVAKMAKNIFIVGSVSLQGDLTNFSSIGPALDGRILPNIVAIGPGGTSHASPNLAGVFAQLNHAYSYHNGGIIPPAGLLKAVILNTADDLENAGPDFRTGFGLINARRGYEVIKAHQIVTGSVGQSGVNTHQIIVPPNLTKLKVMVYWTDWEATPGISTKALVNDLDIVLEDPSNQTYQPWVLNPTFNPITLSDLPVRTTDTLNNIEQVTIDYPPPGIYQLNVTGTMIPQGPLQSYFLTYEFVSDEIHVIHPHGGEKFVPNEIERIRWDACDSNLTFDIDYSLDQGVSWQSIVTGVNSGLRYYDWTVPSVISNEAILRVTRGSTVGESDTTFTIYEQVHNLQHVMACADSSLFIWDSLPGADGYVFYKIVGNYMDSIAYTSQNSFVVHGFSLSEPEYVSIAAVKNGVVGRRMIAIERPAGAPCNLDDVSVAELISPSPAANNLPACMMLNGTILTINIKNFGFNSSDSIPIAVQVNNGTIFHDTVYSSISAGQNFDFSFGPSPYFALGTNTIKIWSAASNDSNVSNDTLTEVIDIYPSYSQSPNFIQSFDAFTNCSSSWGCASINCQLSDGWYNIPNSTGDDIDWRVNDFSTGSANTGPSFDHTSGTGKYLYLEGSGNGGSGCSNSDALLYSPCIDLNNVASAQMSFWYHAFGSSIGELHIDILQDGLLIEDIIPPITGDQGDQWFNQIADLTPYTGYNVVIIIRGSTGGGYLSDLAIDDINISTSPVVNFQPSLTQICSSQGVTLTNLTNYGNNYQWTISPNTFSYINATNSNSNSPQLMFNDSGYYSVQLFASNFVGNDSLLLNNTIYVWGDSPKLSPIQNYCAGDSVIIHSNNNGQQVSYYLNSSQIDSNANNSHYYSTAQDNDDVYAIYFVNSSCTLYSDTLTISITDINQGVTQNGNALISDQINANYQWIDCAQNYLAIAGENNQTFFPSGDGDYAVSIEMNGCLDTSYCFSYSTAHLQESGLQTLVIYPNPAKDHITVDFGEIIEDGTLSLFSANGQLISEYKIQDETQYLIDLPISSGVYFLRINVPSKVNVTRRITVKSGL